MPLLSEVTTETQALLNDASGKIWTQAILLPYQNKAYRELQQEIANVGGSVVKEQTAALTIPLAAVKITFSSTPALPAALLYPIQLLEKMAGQPDAEYTPMEERPWVPFATQGTRLLYWTWIDDEIRFLGATVAVPIIIRYMQGFANLIDGTSAVGILDSVTFLAARSAALASMLGGSNPTRAQVLQQDADRALDVLLNKIIKNRQGMPIRRRKFRSFRFRPFFGI